MRPPGSGNRPTRALVELVISLVARESGVGKTKMLSSHEPKATQARWRAWAMIIDLSGCSMNGLADVWGVERQAIRRARNILRARAA